MPTKPLKPWIWQHPEWPKFRWDAGRLSPSIATARRAQGELIGMARLLDPDSDFQVQLEVLTAEGVATSAIEGVRFDPSAVRSSLARRLGLPTAGLPAPPRTVEGVVDVLLDATQSLDKRLTEKMLCDWQAAIFPTGRSGLNKIRVGKLRGTVPMHIVSGPVGKQRVHYEAPPRSCLDRETKQFLRWFNAPPAHLDGLLRAGVAHAWFELIHPFEDGNGRVGRALLDRALAQDEGRPTRLYSLSARFMTVRSEYYDALQAMLGSTLDATDWLLWFLDQITVSCSDSARTIERVLAKPRFWMRHGQSGLNARQNKALNLLLEAGPAGFVGGMTNRKYAHLNRVSPATAQRDLAELTARGILSVLGGGRSVRYGLVGSHHRGPYDEIVRAGVIQPAAAVHTAGKLNTILAKSPAETLRAALSAPEHGHTRRPTEAHHLVDHLQRDPKVTVRVEAQGVHTRAFEGRRINRRFIRHCNVHELVSSDRWRRCMVAPTDRSSSMIMLEWRQLETMRSPWGSITHANFPIGFSERASRRRGDRSA